MTLGIWEGPSCICEAPETGRDSLLVTVDEYNRNFSPGISFFSLKLINIIYLYYDEFQTYIFQTDVCTQTASHEILQVFIQMKYLSFLSIFSSWKQPMLYKLLDTGQHAHWYNQESIELREPCITSSHSESSCILPFKKINGSDTVRWYHQLLSSKAKSFEVSAECIVESEFSVGKSSFTTISQLFPIISIPSHIQ